MSARLTLDDWLAEGGASPREAIIGFARLLGQSGFTADDLRTASGVGLRNPGAVLGSLVANGHLRVVGEEPSRTLSSKHRRVRRYVIVEGSP